MKELIFDGNLVRNGSGFKAFVDIGFMETLQARGHGKKVSTLHSLSLRDCVKEMTGSIIQESHFEQTLSALSLLLQSSQIKNLDLAGTEA
eukprot:gene19441-26100_t